MYNLTSKCALAPSKSVSTFWDLGSGLGGLGFGGLGFGGLGFKGGLGFRVIGFRVWAFRALGTEFRI